MSQVLCVTIRFLDPVPSFHGKGDGDEPEWPPSPLRLFQALVDAAASRWRESKFGEYAQPFLVWLERLGRPEIVAPAHHYGMPFRLSGPNNDMDAPARKWVKGEETIKPHRPMDLRTMKAVHPTHIRIGDGKHCDALHYLFALPGGKNEYLEVLQATAQSITHLGWGIDMAVGDAAVIPVEETAKLKGVRWRPSPVGGTPLRVPKQGTLEDLIRKHTDFLGRVTKAGFRPVSPLRVFDVVRYRSQDEPIQQPCRIFELRNLDGARFRYPHRKLIHIAGMVRHLSIRAMERDVPPHIRKLSEREQREWVETYIAGHRKGRKADLDRERKCEGADDSVAVSSGGAVAEHRESLEKSDAHRQLSYLPLPSIGMDHTDPGVRRVMIVAPLGDEDLLDYVARRLAGQQLKALNERTPEFGVDEHGQPRPGPLLVPLTRVGDGVTRRYTGSSSIWHSFTPVILPGHDDHKSGKTRALIERALLQSGVEQPCEFEWSPVSRFPRSYSAHKYDLHKRPQGYIRPRYLLSQTAVHLTLRFHDGSSVRKPVRIPGPLAIGPGRHCGFGLMVVDETIC